MSCPSRYDEARGRIRHGYGSAVEQAAKRAHSSFVPEPLCSEGKSIKSNRVQDEFYEDSFASESEKSPGDEASRGSQMETKDGGETRKWREVGMIM